MSLRFGCFVLLCFKIQYKMILSEIPRNIIWGKDNRMLNELYSRACYFYPHSSSPLARPRATGGGGSGAAEAEPQPGPRGWRSQLEEGSFPRAAARWHRSPPPPGGASGLAQGPTRRRPELLLEKRLHLLGRSLIDAHSRKEAVSGA